MIYFINQCYRHVWYMYMQVKGTMSSQAHACSNGRRFEKVGPTFSNSVEDSVSLFQSLSIASISGREATFAFKDQSLVIK